MTDNNRRKDERDPSYLLKKQLNADQRQTLSELERFGWELKFIRRKPFQPPIPVIFDGDRSTYAVLREDGTLDETPAGIDIRH